MLQGKVGNVTKDTEMHRAIIYTATLLAAPLVISTPAHSGEGRKGVRLGKVVYSGSACPQGSISARLHQNNTRLKLNFKQYVIEVRGRNKRSIRKTCDISLPLKIPKGMSVSLVSANYSGKVALPIGSHARMTTTYAFTGKRGHRYKTDIHGPHHKGYKFHDPLSALASVWSACGKDARLRIITSTRIKKDAGSGISRTDSRQGFVTRLRYRSCQ